MALGATGTLYRQGYIHHGKPQPWVRVAGDSGFITVKGAQSVPLE